MWASARPNIRSNAVQRYRDMPQKGRCMVAMENVQRSFDNEDIYY